MLVFKYLGQKMNFKDIRVSAHTFRHTFCHRFAMSGMLYGWSVELFTFFPSKAINFCSTTKGFFFHTLF
ncbi:hypothetical protein ACQKNS_24430 [Peribacillus sp. NPDC094092]|uniref:hypothetical protein n=1 Tax=Peribacillus sp. NPDC094092 TaxID=3390611 RepID=UPI003D02D61C